MATHCSPRFEEHIAYALKNPFHKGISRIESRQYISFYEEDESCNQLLLKLAKIDFNRVQIWHQQELVEILRWHKELDVEVNFPYSRDRPVETYLWTVGTFFESHYATTRKFLTKFTILLTYLDDTYDAYGTIEELRLLTNAIQRWDSDHLEEAPNSMKFLCKAYLDLFHEKEEEFNNEGKPYHLSYAIDAVLID
ncbi:beta-caryophyllene synthase-like [Tripterygium wilfordii]|uniref:beta-caryophyllene synthase-like n=1 Tax=Tripterygium wilfordii TaxID=458696 RepID=UPI0018F8159B|nr:beta-caryophyllene synthase-like [Tripterygium wilfordii]